MQDTIARTLSSFDEPPTLTDLRERVGEKLPWRDPEEIREFLFALISAGKLRITQNYRIYR